MTLLHTILHKFISAKPDSTDSSLVRPSNWNDEHDVEVTAAEGTLLGALVGGGGVVTDIPMGTGLTISGGSIVGLFSMPIGAILDFGGESPPDGWLLCDGTEVLRADYPDLFGVIGENFGAGDGLLTFRLPDLRGRVTAGLDTMGDAAAAERLTEDVFGAATDTLGNAGGEETHLLTIEEMPIHDHPIDDPVEGVPGTTVEDGIHQHFIANVESLASLTPSIDASSYLAKQNNTSDNRDFLLAGTGTVATVGLTSSVEAHTHVITPQGGGEKHSSVQPTLLVTKIIYAGVVA